MKTPRYFESFGKSALQIKRTSSSRNDEATLTFTFAPMLNSQGDWTRKADFQLKAQSELVEFALLMLGRVSEVKFNNHGKNCDKSLIVRRNDNADIYLSFKNSEVHYDVVLSYTSCYMLLSLATTQLKDRLVMTFEEALQVLRLMPIPQHTPES